MSSAGTIVEDEPIDAGVVEDVDTDDAVDGAPLPTGEQSDDEVEERALRMGWVPYDRFRGDKAKWTPAREFVTRGEEMLGISRALNHTLETKLGQRDKVIENLTRSVQESHQALKDVVSRSRGAEERGYKRAMAEIEAKKRQAVADGDQAAYDSLVAEQGQLAEDHREAVTPAAAPPPEPTTPQAPPHLEPAVQEFIAQNGWFNTDPQLRDSAVYHHRNVIREGNIVDLAAQLEEAKLRVAREFPERFGVRRQPASAQQQQRRPRVATVQAPSSAPPQYIQGQNGALSINSIQDPADREQARKEFRRLQNSLGSNYTEAEYMEVYGDPHADVLEIQKKYRK